MNLFVAITDSEWFDLLSSQPDIEDVNFWQPGGNREFSTLAVNELFLFKLHYPDHFIVGGGLFTHSTLLPVSLAWETFGSANGARSLDEMRARIEKYRRVSPTPLEDYTVGCVLLSRPFFLAREMWIPVPADWHRNIVQGKTYNSDSAEGKLLFDQVIERWRALEAISEGLGKVAEGVDSAPARFGSPLLVKPRLGQASFRIVVTDAYGRRCAITGDRVLPVLEAAHIRPFAHGGPHEIPNGILLRSDLHTLFDRGYLTITPQFSVEVSRRIREEFENGKEYYALHGSRVSVPDRPQDHPSRKNLEWHNSNRYNG